MPTTTRQNGPQRRSVSKPTGGRHTTRPGAEGLALTLPWLGQVHLPPPPHLAWYGAITALAVLEIIDWPVAAVVAIGKALADNQHSRTLQQFGDALEEAG